MDIIWFLVVALAGYFIGSISFSRLIARWRLAGDQIEDVRFHLPDDMGEAEVDVFGANRASMVLGARYGLLVGLLDILKALLPTLVLQLAFPGKSYNLMYAFMSLVGHNWPVYHRFRGGRGFSVILGSFLVIEPLGLLISFLLSTLLGMIILGHPALSYVLWLPMMIPIAWFRTRDPITLIFTVAICVVFFLSTIPEYRIIQRFRREGQYDAYMQAMYQSSPRWRAMTRLTQRLQFWKPRREE
ncbi:MAG: glycerol-3-phosphate acyltransferase [Anaerolineales bacterium]